MCQKGLRPPAGLKPIADQIRRISPFGSPKRGRVARANEAKDRRRRVVQVDPPHRGTDARVPRPGRWRGSVAAPAARVHGRPGFAGLHPAAGRASRGPLNGFPEARAGGCLGSERACEYIWAWVEGESLGYRTLTPLPDVEVGTELESDGIRIARMPHSMSELPSYLPTGHFEPVQQFLGSVVMSVDTRAGPVFNRPRDWDDWGTQVEARWVLGDWEGSLDRFCESLSLAAGAHVSRSGQWLDYGDLRAFGFRHSGLGGGVRPRETTRRDKVHLDQRTLERAWDIHRLRMRNWKNRKPSDTAIDRWLRSMNPRARLADRCTWTEVTANYSSGWLFGGHGTWDRRLRSVKPTTRSSRRPIACVPAQSITASSRVPSRISAFFAKPRRLARRAS